MSQQYTDLLTDWYNTNDTIPRVRVDDDDISLWQGSDLIVLSVEKFEQFVDEMREVIKESQRDAQG